MLTYQIDEIPFNTQLDITTEVVEGYSYDAVSVEYGVSIGLTRYIVKKHLNYVWKMHVLSDDEFRLLRMKGVMPNRPDIEHIREEKAFWLGLIDEIRIP